MDFDQHKSIYLQIAEILCERILAGEWPPEEKIPSVREMAASVQVNPNTVLRSYDFLQQKGIIFNKRGIGYFTESKAVERIQSHKKEDFYENVLPDLFKNMILLNIEPNDIIERYQHYLKSNDTL